mmetsp:Transcript_4556/g.10669  ORF Transcript_4556/g.10669 Transcript_4556/m.10669 type:complete len:492 (+) Transcript_4556:74-1549(+)
MPARVVLPRVLAAAESSESGPGLDLQTKLRRAAAKALEGAGVDALEDDLLEAVACQACEVFDDHAHEDKETCSEALMSALTPLLQEVGFLPEIVTALINAEIGDVSKELPAQLSLSVHPSRSSSTQKVAYRKRGDVERERAAEYLRQQEEEAKRQREEDAVRARDAVDFRRWPQGPAPKEETAALSADAQVKSDSEDDEEDEVTRKDREVTKRRLRELGQPATFFAETDAQRWRRLQSCELARDQDVLADGSTNVMQILDRQQQRAREAAGGIRQGVDIVDAEDAEFATTEGTVSRHAPEDQDSDSEDERPQLASVLGNKPDDRDKEQEEAQRKLDTASHAVTGWIRSMLRAWEATLTERASVEERQQAFKIEKAQYRQSKQYLKPLRRALRDGEVDPGVIFSLAEIADHCGNRSYRAAKEAYMRLAIGNHPWPMGVTFVTFHDRANRHKIGEGAQAHVLDDETTRKYVQMVKRLVTFAEGRWPVDPTKAE